MLDTGVNCALLDLTAEDIRADHRLSGQLAETFVFQELRRMGDWQEARVQMSHFRNKDGVEVDLVLQGSRDRIAGVEVKTGATERGDDFRGLEKLREVTADRFAAGAVLYDDEQVLPFGHRLFAVPFRALWETVEDP